DRFHVASLVGSLLPPGAVEPFRRPPQIRIGGAEAEFTTDEGIEWRIESGRLRLDARVGVRVRRGPLFRLAFRTPANFAPGPIAAIPEDALAYSGTTSGPIPTVEVEFARPLLTGQHVELRFEFRGLPAPSTAARV